MPKLGKIMPKLGTTTSKRVPRRAANGLADALFSKTQQRVLGALFGSSGRSFYATELISRVGGGSGAVQRELARLLKSGLVRMHTVGSQKHYSANVDSPVFAELRGIVLKTVGLADPIRDALRPFERRISAAFIYGSVAKGAETASSDVDLMLISESLAYPDVFAALERAGQVLQRPINPTILSKTELAKRVKGDNAFVSRVLSQPKIWLIGDEIDLAV